MRRIITPFILMVAGAVLAQDPYYVISCDLQEPGDQFTIDRGYLGDNTFIAADIYNGTTNAYTNLAGYTFTLFYAKSQYSTSGVPIIAASTSVNRIYFPGATNTYFQPFDNYWVTLKGIHTSGVSKVFGTGRLIVDFDPMAGSPSVLAGTSPINWGLLGPYSGTWPFYPGTNFSIQTTATGLVLSATLLSGNTGNLFRIYSTGSYVSVANEYGPDALVSVDVSSIRSGLATGTPLYVEAGTGTLTAASLDPYMTSAAITSAFARKVGDVFSGPVTAASFHITSGPAITALGTTNVLIGGVRVMLAGETSGGGDASGWSGYPATQTVNLAANSMKSTSGTGVSAIAASAYGASIFGNIRGIATNSGSHGATMAGYIWGTTYMGLSHGSRQVGYFQNGSSASIEDLSYGSEQAGQFSGTNGISSSSPGGSQRGIFNGYSAVGQSSPGSLQYGSHLGRSHITDGAAGASQIGSVALGASATNSGAGAMQLLHLENGEHSLITQDGDGSLALGRATVSNKWSIAADAPSHGDGSISAASGLWSGDTNISELAGSAHALAVEVAGRTSYTGTFNGALTGNGAGVTNVDAKTLNGQTVTGIFTSSLVIAAGQGIVANQTTGGGITTNTVAVDTNVVAMLRQSNFIAPGTNGGVIIGTAEGDTVGSSYNGRPQLIIVRTNSPGAQDYSTGARIDFWDTRGAGAAPGAVFGIEGINYNSTPIWSIGDARLDGNPALIIPTNAAASSVNTFGIYKYGLAGAEISGFYTTHASTRGASVQLTSAGRPLVYDHGTTNLWMNYSTNGIWANVKMRGPGDAVTNALLEVNVRGRQVNMSGNTFIAPQADKTFRVWVSTNEYIQGTGTGAIMRVSITPPSTNWF